MKKIRCGTVKRCHEAKYKQEQKERDMTTEKRKHTLIVRKHSSVWKEIKKKYKGLPLLDKWKIIFPIKKGKISTEAEIKCGKTQIPFITALKIEIDHDISSKAMISFTVFARKEGVPLMKNMPDNGSPQSTPWNIKDGKLFYENFQLDWEYHLYAPQKEHKKFVYITLDVNIDADLEIV